MNKKIRAVLYGALVALWVALTLGAWLMPNKPFSTAERRPLKQFPALSADTLLSGSFMENFADYTLDQFPLRDSLRGVKSWFSYNVLQRKDNNGIYIEDGYAAKLEYPLNNVSVNNAIKKFNGIYEAYLRDTGSKIYTSVIPDKGNYLARENGYPAMDYEALFAKVAEGMPWAQTVDITKALDISHYYRTDTHWRQEKLLPVAQTLCDAMNVSVPGESEFTPTVANSEFLGVYYGQAALPMAGEALYLMDSSYLTQCRVYNHETKQYQSVYDLEKLSGDDPYEVYLSGAQALLTIENPNAVTDRELIIFRDSFASSLAPLLVGNYRTVTLVDIRYVASALLGQYLDFHGQDVLFAYSTLILNNSASLK